MLISSMFRNEISRVNIRSGHGPSLNAAGVAQEGGGAGGGGGGGGLVVAVGLGDLLLADEDLHVGVVVLAVAVRLRRAQEALLAASREGVAGCRE